MTKNTLRPLSITELAKIQNELERQAGKLVDEVLKRAAAGNVPPEEIWMQVRTYRKKLEFTDDREVEKPEVLKGILERVMPNLEGKKVEEMRRKLGSILSIEGLATLANLADELNSILGRELARRAAKNKASWDDIHSAIKCHRIELETELLRSWTVPPHTPSREIITVKEMAAKVLEEIRQGGK